MQPLKDNWPWIVVPFVIVLVMLWFVSTQSGSIAEFEYAIQ